MVAENGSVIPDHRTSASGLLVKIDHIVESWTD
jgi:hypothetical protein